jgi:aspartyl-tRNA(Asn)/glutamyl-tRNA(Gln) amidotransferase subunit C
MSLDPATVKRIARLARIRLEDEAVPRLQGELNNILGWIETLSEVDVEGVTPLTGGAQIALRLRPDVVNDGDTPRKFWPTRRTERASSSPCRKWWNDCV